MLWVDKIHPLRIPMDKSVVPYTGTERETIKDQHDRNINREMAKQQKYWTKTKCWNKLVWIGTNWKFAALPHLTPAEEGALFELSG